MGKSDRKRRGREVEEERERLVANALGSVKLLYALHVAAHGEDEALAERCGFAKDGVLLLLGWHFKEGRGTLQEMMKHGSEMLDIAQDREVLAAGMEE